MRPLKVVISGGGTGGHIFPAIAIAKALQKKNPNTEILFVGAKGRMEMEKVPAAGYKIIGLTIAGIQRKLDLRNFLLPFKLVKSLVEAHKLLKDFKPDIAIGVGGYASAPTLYMASQMDVPTLIQEQNSYAGLTNKLLAKRASAICVAFPHMEKYFPTNKIVLTGNPVREDLQDISGKREEAMSFFGLDGGRKILLVIGGSLGARTINNAMFDGLHLIEEQGIQVIWQTGKFFFTKAKEKNNQTIKVFDFINRMDLAYAAADVVISRAGALSIAELCLTAKPCILVPSPNVAEDHQTKNAMALVNEGAAQLVKDSEAGKVLVNKALYLLHNDNQQAELKEKISALAMRNAADKIVDEVYKVVRSD